MMKIKTKKEFDVISFMREQRDALSQKLSKMSKEEIVDYFRNKRVANGVKPSA